MKGCMFCCLVWYCIVLFGIGLNMFWKVRKNFVEEKFSKGLVDLDFAFGMTLVRL